MTDIIFTEKPGQMNDVLERMKYHFNKMTSQVSDSGKTSVYYIILRDSYLIANSMGRSIEYLYESSGHSLAVVAIARILIECAATSHFVTTQRQKIPGIEEEFAKTGNVISGKTDKRGRIIYVKRSNMIELLPVESGATWPREFYSEYSSAIHFTSKTIEMTKSTDMEKHAYVMALKTVDLFAKLFESLAKSGYMKSI